MSTALYSLGRWAYLHHRRVLGFWLAAIVISCATAAALSHGTKDAFDIPGTESQEAIDALGRTFPQLSGAGAFLIAIAPSGSTLDEPQAKQLIAEAIDGMRQVDGVSEVVSPYSELTDIAITEDRTAAQIQVQFNRSLEDVSAREKDQLAKTAEPLERAGYEVAFGGDVFTSTGPQLSIIEVLGVVVALIVLYLTFRSFRAAVLPIVTALAGVVVTIATTFAATGFFTISSTAPLLALMIGLAVGIDYALFIVSRHRELLAEGVEPDEACARSVATAGSAVVFAGVTVVIALVGLAIARIPFLTIMGVVAAWSVVVAVIVALTLLPALLGRAGARMRPRKGHAPGSFSRRWAEATTRFPWIAIFIVVVGLAVMSIPGKDLQLALPNNGTAPAGNTERIAFDLIDDHFGPGFNGPLLVTADIITSTDPLGVVKEITDDLRSMPGVEAIGLSTPNPTGDTAVIQVIPTTGPSDHHTNELVAQIRDRAPQWKTEHGVDVTVTGLTAGGIDVSDRLQSALLPFGLVVVGLSVLLLMIVFRSIVVPVKATLGFLLSTGASFGAVVAVFQWGWLRDLVNLDQTGPLISFLPIVLMAVLFGLSMDYEVFLMSRMKEEYVRTGQPHRAIVDGFVGSSRVVTAAAVIMLAVFAAFVPDGDPNIKPIAFALAIGVFADAFLVRMFFAPAVLQLFGRTSWRLPRFFEERLPHIDVEGEALHQRLQLEQWPSTNFEASITAAGLTASGPEGIVFNDVSVQVPAGEWLIVHGPTGSGKTALLLTLSGRMGFDAGRLRVNGGLLPHDAKAVRSSVALAEFAGINDLEANLTVDQHIAERLSIGSFGLWVSRNRITPIRSEFEQALVKAHAEQGDIYTPVTGGTLISSLSRLERKLLGVALALAEKPRMIIVEDVDDLRAAEDIALMWSALDHLLNARDVTLVASVQAASSAPRPSDRIHLLELDTSRTLEELNY